MRKVLNSFQDKTSAGAPALDSGELLRISEPQSGGGI